MTRKVPQSMRPCRYGVLRFCVRTLPGIKINQVPPRGVLFKQTFEHGATQAAFLIDFMLGDTGGGLPPICFNNFYCKNPVLRGCFL